VPRGRWVGDAISSSEQKESGSVDTDTFVAYLMEGGVRRMIIAASSIPWKSIAGSSIAAIAAAPPVGNCPLGCSGWPKGQFWVHAMGVVGV
jgi:hypothetical protein